MPRLSLTDEQTQTLIDLANNELLYLADRLVAYEQISGDELSDQGVQNLEHLKTWQARIMEVMTILTRPRRQRQAKSEEASNADSAGV